MLLTGSESYPTGRGETGVSAAVSRGMIRAVIAHRPAFAAAFGSRTGWPTAQQAHGLVGARHLEDAECFAVPPAGAAICVVNIDVFLCQLFAEVGQGPGVVAQLDDDDIVFSVARS